MSGHESNQNRGILRTLIDNSALLVAGAVIALIWANVDNESYLKLVNYDLAAMFSGDAGHGATDVAGADVLTANPETLADGAHAHNEDSVGGEHDHADDEAHEHSADAASIASGGQEQEGHHGLTIHFVINDILMALFFAIAGKEVWESLLPGGPLSNPKKAATPLLATVGGIAGPALVYLAGAFMFGGSVFETFNKGWAIPCATDIAFSYLIARIIFGAAHPAIAFLLLLAIADDAAGLIILAIFYPSAAIQPAWLLLSVGAILMAMFMRRQKVHSHWAYMLGPGVLCWLSFYFAHIHPALGLVPIIPILPHAHTDLGIFAREELKRHDTLNEFEHFWLTPVQVVLGLFGLANAGVVLSAVGEGTWLVLAGLLIGKPLGITLMTLFAEKGLKLEKPAGMDYRHIVTLGMIAGIGFTVALFVSVAAFTQPGAVQDSVKMGALLSFAAAPLAIIMGKAFGIQPLKIVASESNEKSHAA